jgi:polar amino acid transport system substrate-binding protein
VNRPALVFAAILAFAGPVSPSLAADTAAKAELAPTGKLRIALAVAPAPSALYVIEDHATKSYRGVAADLGRLLAQKLDVPAEFVPYRTAGEITADADKNKWDITFMPVDEEGRKAVSFGNAFHILQSTYLVAPDSGIKSIADVNRGGVRVGSIPNSTALRASKATAPNADHVTAASVGDLATLMKSRKVDAIALARETLVGLAKDIPGSRILDGAFFNSTTSIAVPNNKPLSLAYVNDFIESAKASGAVRKAFDDIGLTMAVVAPAGKQP